MTKVRSASWFLWAGVLLLGSGSCASYTARLKDLRSCVEKGELDRALEQVEHVSEPGDLLYHLERGTLLHYANRYSDSNAELERAEELLEDLYTVSVSQRALTFLLNDEVEACRGEIHEGNYLHYYRILNFLSQNKPDAAAVEARRLALRLATVRDKQEKDRLLRDDAFLEFLIGRLLESKGEWNSSLVAYRLAYRARSAWHAETGLDLLPWLERDILRAAWKTGISLEDIPEVAHLKGSAWLESRAAADSEDGRVLILFESGWVPKKESVHLRVPIFECDPDWDGEEEAVEMGWVLAERCKRYRADGRWADRELAVAYFLDVALPVLAQEHERDAVTCRVQVDPLGSSRPQSWDERAFSTHPGVDLAVLVRHEFAIREASILAKAFARAL
ncbi:MAG: hypothetical protein KAY24_15755, partial [Candidatus Eisenbacteria sp.]|nr:hypothetical protein [Candidatus Eisenbacteria bacterium]